MLTMRIRRLVYSIEILCNHGGFKVSIGGAGEIPNPSHG